MRRAIPLIAVLVLLTSLGCQPSTVQPGGQAPTVAFQPNQEPAGEQPAPPPPEERAPAEGATAEALTPSQAAERVWRSLERWGSEPDTTGAPSWAGMDGAGRLVLVAEPSWDFAEHNQKYVPLMFQKDPSVERIVVWRTYFKRSRPLLIHDGYFSVVERTTYEGWPEGEKVPFPMEEWGSRVDRHAERHGVLTGVQLEDIMALSERWVQSILGDRLSELRFAPYQDYPDLVSLHLTVDDPNAPEQERVVEAALVGGLPVLTGVVLVEVKYPGVPQAETIEATRLSMTEWHDFTQGDPQYHAGWLTIDGVMDYSKRPNGYGQPEPEYSPYALIDLMEARPRLETLLPEGADLILGMHRLGGGVAGVEATVPLEWSAEQRWAVYTEVVDKLFAEDLDLEYVNLILYQGHEVEVIRLWKDTWSVRSYLTQATGQALEPITLPLMAQWYDRYTLVDR